MKLLSKLSLCAIAILLAGCNEKVSPELQEGNSTTPAGDGSSPTIVPEEYYFKLTNKAPTLFNYKLHKTGASNQAAACEVRSSTPLNNDNFVGAPSINDISCFLEAEELSLSWGGLSFEMEASPNTCEFIAYAPYSYYNMIPGDSSGSYMEVSCMTDQTDSTQIDRVAAPNLGGPDISYDPGGGPVNASCDQILSTSSILAGVRQVASKPIDDRDLCRFDYTSTGGPNCDEGTIYITDWQVTFDVGAAEQAGNSASEAAMAPLMAQYSDTTDDDGGGPDDGLGEISPAEQASIDSAGATAYVAAYDAHLPTTRSETRKIECGGKAVNCIEGPLTEHSEIKDPRGSIIYGTTFDEVAKQAFEYEKIIDTGLSNLHYANYRRDLANSQIDYGTSEHDYLSLAPLAYNAFYLGAWSTPVLNKIFEPNLMERYSRNLHNNQTRMIDPVINLGDGVNTIYERAATEADTYTAKPLAAEPFVGMGNKYYTNPFYTFYCLDTAFDIKARIRLAVRDWDRVFPNNSDLELISDIHKGSSARQDIQGFEEDTDSTDDYNEFNDRFDWDDLISMERYTAGGVLIYRPLPTASVTEGYFNTLYFPNVIIEDN